MYKNIKFKIGDLVYDNADDDWGVIINHEDDSHIISVYYLVGRYTGRIIERPIEILKEL